MKMPTRAAIEAILKKHQVVVADVIGVPPSCGGALVDDLFALLERTQPSREALEKIVDNFCIGFGSPSARWMCIERLMAWAQGELRREWCEHIKSTTFMGQTVWVYETTDCPSGVIFGMNFDTCPICAVPRPKEAT